MDVSYLKVVFSALVIAIHMVISGISFMSQHFLLKTVCRTPIAQIFHLSSCAPAPVQVEYERLYGKYEALLEVAAPQQPRGFKMKRLEIATRDLSVMVRSPLGRVSTPLVLKGGF
jgi:hypothetical protein